MKYPLKYVVLIAISVATLQGQGDILRQTPITRASDALNKAKAINTYHGYSGAINTISRELATHVGNRNFILLLLENTITEKKDSLSNEEVKSLIKQLTQAMKQGATPEQSSMIEKAIKKTRETWKKQAEYGAAMIRRKDTQIEKLNQQTHEILQAREQDKANIKALEGMVRAGEENCKTFNDEYVKRLQAKQEQDKKTVELLQDTIRKMDTKIQKLKSDTNAPYADTISNLEDDISQLRTDIGWL